MASDKTASGENLHSLLALPRILVYDASSVGYRRISPFGVAHPRVLITGLATPDVPVPDEPCVTQRGSKLS